MILGCGIDLMDVGRFEREVASRGGDLLDELFSRAELARCREQRRPAEGYAMRYAAKEACFKALGTGKSGRMAWKDVEITWAGPGGRPAIALTGETAAAAASIGVTGVHIALTTTREHAVAWVVVTG